MKYECEYCSVQGIIKSEILTQSRKFYVRLYLNITLYIPLN